MYVLDRTTSQIQEYFMIASDSQREKTQHLYFSLTRVNVMFYLFCALTLLMDFIAVVASDVMCN